MVGGRVGLGELSHSDSFRVRFGTRVRRVRAPCLAQCRLGPRSSRFEVGEFEGQHVTASRQWRMSEEHRGVDT